MLFRYDTTLTETVLCEKDQKDIQDIDCSGKILLNLFQKSLAEWVADNTIQLDFSPQKDVNAMNLDKKVWKEQENDKVKIRIYYIKDKSQDKFNWYYAICDISDTDELNQIQLPELCDNLEKLLNENNLPKDVSGMQRMVLEALSERTVRTQQYVFAHQIFTAALQAGLPEAKDWSEKMEQHPKDLEIYIGDSIKRQQKEIEDEKEAIRETGDKFSKIQLSPRSVASGGDTMLEEAKEMTENAKAALAKKENMLGDLTQEFSSSFDEIELDSEQRNSRSPTRKSDSLRLDLKRLNSGYCQRSGSNSRNLDKAMRSTSAPIEHEENSLSVSNLSSQYCRGGRSRHNKVNLDKAMRSTSAPMKPTNDEFYSVVDCNEKPFRFSPRVDEYSDIELAN